MSPLSWNLRGNYALRRPGTANSLTRDLHPLTCPLKMESCSGGFEVKGASVSRATGTAPRDTLQVRPCKLDHKHPCL